MGILEGIFTVEDGVTFYKFTCSYAHDGKMFDVSFWARDFDDAAATIENMKATLDGGSIAKVVEEFWPVVEVEP